MAATPPFTTGNDFLNIYRYFKGSSGYPVETDLAIIGKTFDMGTGVDEIYMDGSTGEQGAWFNLSATETGVLTITSASGSKVIVVGAEKFTYSNGVTINLGTAAADTINGGSNSEKFLYGLAGNDTINGLGGDDVLMGGANNDTLNGGDGLDKLIGGLNKDRMTGGLGKDVFDFNKLSESGASATLRDVITDFVHLTDKIDLSTIDAKSATAAVNDGFAFIGTSAFTQGVAGKVHYQQVNAAGTANDYTLVSGDVNGDRVADFHIQLTGLKTLTAADFIL